MRRTKFIFETIFSYKGLVVFLSLSMVYFSVNYLASANWVSPLDDPPGANVEVPVNVGNDLQVKLGGLTLGAHPDFSGIALNVPYGDISATNNVRENCEWTVSVCDDEQICGDNKFVAGVQRHTADAFCGGGTRRWYRMSLHCCDL